MPKILILSSNPRRDLNLDREISDLTTALQRLGKFEIRLGLGARSQQLPDLLTEHSPEFVHFCGHGAGEQGLVFQDENGRERLLSTEILARIFNTFADEINCVVLNACDSDRQAEAIVVYINYVVGMSQPILDQAALIFAVGFYKGLASEKSIDKSYELGCIAIQIWSEENSQSTQSREYRKAEYAGEIAQLAQPNLPEHLKPVLRKKSMLLSSSAKINLVPEVPSSKESPNLPPGFEEVVRQEIDRKEYKDNARAAYDNFGQFSAQNVATLGKSENKQRKILLGKVKEFWIEGFLQPSLKGVAALSLDLKSRPDAIANLSEAIEALSVELDDSFDQLSKTRIYEEMGQGRTLLILGYPGAGKTIALLQLAQRLIERGEQNLSLPIPVVFNLSSWAKDRKAIVDWLIDELREKYQVPKSLSEPWIEDQQLILLLDGLDEVNEEHRNDCVRALNKFMGLFPQTEVAVCSRVRDYEALTERLQISTALCLQPLSSEQVYQTLDSVGGSLAGLKTLLKRDAELEQFAQTPMILNFMSVAYQGLSAEKLIPQLHPTTDRHKHLFDTYIDRRLERGAASEYSKDKVLRWLRWLASWMVEEKQTIFLIEKMQPTCLENRNDKCAYRIICFIYSGLIPVALTMLLISPIYWLAYSLERSNKNPLDNAVIVGIFIGLISGIITSFQKEISPVEQLSWSWQRVKPKFNARSFFVLIFVLIFVLLEIISNYGSAWLILLAYGLYKLGGGLTTSELEQRTVPNQGIRRSLTNCLILGTFYGLETFLILLSFSLGVGVKNTKPLLATGLVGVFIGLILAMKSGGAAYIQHFTLRQILFKKGCIPWNYAKFLDFASEHLLMKKIGGGYVFFHRMLLEHFAQMDRSNRSRVPVSESTSQSIAKSNPHTNVNSSSAGNISNTTPQSSNPVQNRIVCSNCSHNNSTDSKFCTKCGRQLIKHP
jgi:hypothetical protein